MKWKAEETSQEACMVPAAREHGIPEVILPFLNR